jgi:hypothetical protein
MNTAKILTGSVTGTLVMTMFSYLVSEKKNKLFKEPALLNLLLGKVKSSDLHQNHKNPEGWIIHYLVGLFFTVVYDQVWKKTKLNPSLKSGLLLGGINGLIAVAVWKTTFKLHPRPPLIDYKKYYNHLVLAHLVFGAFTVIGYKIPELSGTRNS